MSATTPPAATHETGLAGIINWLTSDNRLLLIAGFLVAMFLFHALLTSQLAKRLWRNFEDNVLNNWRLVLLGLTGLVLSLASGWTTWDGMRNFTQEPLLSLMITFGIQGVMLIVAWLIGESFASGMSHKPGKDGGRWDLVATGMFALLLITAGIFWIGQSAPDAAYATSLMSKLFSADTANKVIQFCLMLAATVLVLAFVFALANSDLGSSYIQSARVIVKSAVLWVMFLACMATSVFFSFDSLFSTIFPKEERKRAADLRTQNQVAGLVAELGAVIKTRQIEEARALFVSPGWKAYDGELDKLASQARTAQSEIERYFIQQTEQRNAAAQEQRERIATARSGQAGLVNKKTSLMEELSRLQAERPGLAAEYAQHKTELDTKAKEIDAKRVEALAEERGVEGTGKIGRGQVYRQRMGELGRLQDELKIKEERTNNAKTRLDRVETRLSQIQRELAAVDGDIAKLKGEEQTANERITTIKTAPAENDGSDRVDPARVLPTFLRAREEFRREPTVARLSTVQQLCTQMLGAMSSAPAIKERVRDLSCDPKAATEAAARVFALNAGAIRYASNCQGGERLPKDGGTDAFLEFGKTCVQDSGLPGSETAVLRNRLNAVALNRDDKAHRFVVTWNAFQDGNRLAYLALAIAIAIDALVFMSGLFGANAVRSPLSDVPSSKARSARQLEAIIDNALLPDRFGNAQVALDSMHPMTSERGFSQEVLIESEDSPAKRVVLRVLNAGATIGAVERDMGFIGRDGIVARYLVRSELFEFLSLVSKRAFDADKTHVRLSELERAIGVALLPDMRHASEQVLGAMLPIEERHGFTSEVRLDRADQGSRALVLKVLNIGSTFQVVQRAGDSSDHFFIHGDVVRVLNQLHARSLLSMRPGRNQLSDGRPPEFRGALSSANAELPVPEAPAGYLEDATSADPATQPKSHRTHTTASAVSKDPPPLPFDEEAFTAEVRMVLLDHLRIPVEAFGRVIEPEARMEALAAAAELTRQRVLYASLQKRVADRLYDLERATEALDQHHRSSSERRAIIADVAAELEVLMPALVIAPEVNVLGNVIADLEVAAGPDEGLKPDEQVLLDRLRNLRGRMGRMAEAGTFDWKVVARHAEQLSEPAAAPVQPVRPPESSIH